MRKSNTVNSLYYPLHPLTFLEPESKPKEQQNPRRCRVLSQGLVPYSQAWQQQHSLIHQRLANPHLDDVLILLEHPPVYTLGTGANPDFLKFDPAITGWEVQRVERGGEVTYHCPGQLVVYPILNLRYYRQDLHWYLRQLEEVVIQLLRKYGLKGQRISGLTGVWLGDCKVAAMGIKVKRWLTMHGFAINVCPDLKGFEAIIPCGITDKSVGSLAQFIPGLEMEKVRQDLLIAFVEVFGVELVNS